jgi:hypothetical protein
MTHTLFQDTDLGLPMDAIYNEELDLLRSQGRKIAEVGGLATNADFRRYRHQIPMLGNKIIFQYATRHIGIDDFVIAINPKHEMFYKYILLFEKIGDLRNYKNVKSAPAVAYRLDLHRAEQRLKEIYDGMPAKVNLYKFFVVDESDNIELPESDQTHCVWNKEKVDYFFKKMTSIWKNTDQATKNYLREICSYLN